MNVKIKDVTKPDAVTLKTVGELRAYLAGIDGAIPLELIPTGADMGGFDYFTVDDDIGVEDGKLQICI